jgi:hypothetical protein
MEGKGLQYERNSLQAYQAFACRRDAHVHTVLCSTARPGPNQLLTSSTPSQRLSFHVKPLVASGLQVGTANPATVSLISEIMDESSISLAGSRSFTRPI